MSEDASLLAWLRYVVKTKYKLWSMLVLCNFDTLTDSEIGIDSHRPQRVGS
jgi:hypothetical protein